jgi:voltage-dependent calcium channel
MLPQGSQDPANPSTPPQSIPLRDLARPPDSVDGRRQHNRGRSLLSGGSRPTSGQKNGPQYERIGDTSPSPTTRATYRAGGVPPLNMNTNTRTQPFEEVETPTSPVGNPADFQAAMGFAGLLVPDISVSHAPQRADSPHGSRDFDGMSPYGDAGDDHQGYFALESDSVPLTNPNHLQPVSGTEAYASGGQQHDRSGSFHSVNFDTPGPSRHRGSRLGDELGDAENGLSPHGGRSKSHSYGASLTPDGRTRSRSPSTTSGAFSRAGSIVRAMSQRVVNISGEAEFIGDVSARREARREREASRAPSIPSMSSLSDESETRFQPKHKADPLAAGPNYNANLPTAPVEKAMRFFGGAQPEPTLEEEPEKPSNPLKGKSLGIFSPESRIRNLLCDLLVYPLTEPVILILIMVQTVLLAVNSSKSVYDYPRPEKWASTPIDMALLVLFIIFTLELAARTIVSGFIMNAPEYSTVAHNRGVKAVVMDKYRQVFAPQRQSSIREPRPSPSISAPTFIRSFTQIQSEQIRTVEQAQRLQLARRAFLRHGFNRLDFVAVVAFWVAFILSITGIEYGYHLYIFRMLSCLRILRLLALTNGTAVCFWILL